MLERRRVSKIVEQEPAHSELDVRKLRDEKIDRVLSPLNRLEAEVIKLRYGLSDGYIYSYDEIGEQFRTTPDCIAEIERRSVERLRSRPVTPQR
jgi:RNA polymerase primary sigma factor